MGDHDDRRGHRPRRGSLTLSSRSTIRKRPPPGLAASCGARSSPACSGDSAARCSTIRADRPSTGAGVCHRGMVAGASGTLALHLPAFLAFAASGHRAGRGTDVCGRRCSTHRDGRPRHRLRDGDVVDRLPLPSGGGRIVASPLREPRTPRAVVRRTGFAGGNQPDTRAACR